MYLEGTLYPSISFLKKEEEDPRPIPLKQDGNYA
jgi:hypothetical protein